jgi:hypothetical protein
VLSPLHTYAICRVPLAAKQKRPKSLTRGRENFAREAKISLEERSIVGRPKLARALEDLATGDVLPLIVSDDAKPLIFQRQKASS